MKRTVYIIASVVICGLAVAFADTLLNLGDTAAPGEVPKWDGEQWRNAHDNVGIDQVETGSGLSATNTNGTVHLSLLYPPVGSVVAWLKSYENTPDLPEGWVECNGQMLSDTNSLYHGQAIPNLNGAVSAGLKGRFLRGHSESGQIEDSQNLQHSHSHSRVGAQNDSTGGSGWAAYSRDLVTGTTSTEGGPESRPHNYSVVWIMRVK